MSELSIKCINHVLTLVNTPDISSGNVNYDTVVFDFCVNWTGYTKTAVFYRNEDEVYYQLLDSSNRCVIPKEVLQSKGRIKIGVFGVSGNKTITSNVLTYSVMEGAITEDIKPSDPTPDIYAQILEVAVGNSQEVLDALEITNARIDNLATLEEGSTTGDAELMDIRVGANGVTYPNAGSAVRGQYNDLKSLLTLVNSASGDQGAPIVITDGTNNEVVTAEIFGKSTQNYYTGKNLYPEYKVGTSNAINMNHLSVVGQLEPDTVYYIAFKGTVGNKYVANAENFNGTIDYPLDTLTVKEGVNVIVAKTRSEPFTQSTTALLKNKAYNSDPNFSDVMVMKVNEPIPYEPYTGRLPSPSPDYPQPIESKIVNRVDVMGGQLLDLKANTSSTLNGFSVSVESGYILKVSGTPTAVWANLTDFDTKKLPKGKYTFSVDKTPTELGVNLIGIKFRKSFDDSENVTYLITDSNKRVTFDRLEDFELIQIYVEGCDTSKAYNFTIKVMLNVGQTAFPFEPHKETYASISTPNGFPGIKVASGGNYVDSDGQNWIADSIRKNEDGTGVYIQRVERFTIAENMVINDPIVSTYGDYISVELPCKPMNTPGDVRIIGEKFVGISFSQRTSVTDIYRVYVDDNNSRNIIIFRIPSGATDFATLESAKAIVVGTVVDVVLNTPIETELSAVQLAELEKIRTFKYNTTIFSDVGVKVEYVADTKAYIDNKFNELATAILNN